ncbi:MAG: iron-containing alcohol dehydrogenase [Acidimicrobiia bacterium]
MQAQAPTAPIVLIGLMGAGKSTVGPFVARRAGRRFIDADVALEQRSGRRIADIFATDGEAAFRALEHDVLAELLADPSGPVIGAGGGAVSAEANRALLVDAGAAVVWLDAAPATLAARVGEDVDRPMLAGGALAALTRLAEQRRPAYEAAATVRVDAGRGVPEQVAEGVLRALRASAPAVLAPEPAQRVTVGLGERSYPVVVGAGALRELASLLPAATRKVAVVSQAGVLDGAGVDLTAVLPVEHRVFLLGDGEEAKVLASVEHLCRQWAQWGLSRLDTVVAVGGGVVTDVAGFAAAVYHRGVPVLHVPTTLLGQIDAAIGGKTGVNLPEGKNLVGAFWQPAAVLCDTDTLIGLPERDYLAGLGELAKYHFLGGGALDTASLPERVYRSVRIKAEVVSGDEREDGRRAILNYGHTLAHALEIAGTFGLRHGEAVAIGLPFAAHLAHGLERIDGARVDEHYRVLRAYGLPDRLPEGIDVEELLQLMGRDKKALRGLTFVLERGSPTTGYDVEVVEGVDADRVRAAFAAMAAHHHADAHRARPAVQP